MHLGFPSPSWKIAGFLLSVWGACFFKPTPGMRLQMLIVCYLVTTSVMLTRPFLWEGLERKFPTIKKKVFLSLSNAIVCCLVEFVVQFTCHFHSTFFLLLMMGCFSSCFLRSNLWWISVVYSFLPPALLRSNWCWHITFCKFKVYSIQYMYILQNISLNNVS